MFKAQIPSSMNWNHQALLASHLTQEYTKENIVQRYCLYLTDIEKTADSPGSASNPLVPAATTWTAFNSSTTMVIL